jgi:PmbA protein
MSPAHEALARRLVQRAVRKGARQADAFLQVGRQADVRVRDGAIEDLTQATSKGLGLRVFVDRRLGFAWTSDFTDLDALVDRAIALARASAPNPLNGLPEAREQGAWPEVGPLHDEQVASLRPEWKIETALELERVVRAYDPRIKTIESVGAGESVSEVYLATSAGVHGGYRGTSVYLYASPVASDGDQLQTATWYDQRRFLAELASPEVVAREAARRALRLLGARKVPSCRVPVVFDPAMAASFVSTIASACSGDAVYRRSSFLAGSLGERVAPTHVTIVDDGLLPRGLATSPFDGEGVATRRTALVQQGMLEGFLYDAFTARKAKKRTTGNASRSYRSLPGIGTNNLYLEAGQTDPARLVRDVPRGLYVTAMLGHGANLVTGEYSRGANGLWIEGGELTRPVQEVTVAGNLAGMLASLEAVGSDLTFFGGTGAPTIRFAELTVSGG